MAERGSLSSGLVFVALCSVLLTHAPAAVNAAQCLTPAAEPALKQLLDANTLRTALGSDLKLESVNLAGDHIALRATDSSGRTVGVTLTLSTGPFNFGADGRGTHFVFQLLRSDSNEKHDRALLAAAALIDRAVPDAALAECSRPPDGSGSKPRAAALGSAVIQIAILLGAAAYGWRSLPR